MHETNLARLDLNLFVVFEAIYREGSISRAARQLNLTQPAVSHALARLRERLDDALFVRRGNQMVPTARARALADPVREALAGLQHCLEADVGFAPQAARRTFVLGLRDGLEACVLPPLLQFLHAEAPGVDVQSVMVARRDLAHELASGRVDLALDVQLPMGNDIEQHKLLDAGLVVVMRHDHPLAAKDLTMEGYLAARHVLVSSRRRGPGLEDFGLGQYGYRRELTLRCQHYQSALEVVAQTDLLVTLPDMLAQRLAPAPRFVSRALPLALPGMGLYLYWHRDQHADAGHVWLRENFINILHRVQDNGRSHGSA